MVYPNFNNEFNLETKASYHGLGAVLFQTLKQNLLHQVASRALSKSVKDYAVTELETLAVIWAIKHVRAYLYEHNVQVVKDHSAANALLGAPSASGKQAI